MKLIKQPNRWSCLVTSFAMVLDTDVETLVAEVGHDGSEPVFGSVPDPYARRGFHIQEMVDVAINRDYAVIGIEFNPTFASPVFTLKLSCKEVLFPGGNARRLMKYLTGNNGVLIGQSITGSPHAVAWNGEMILDPDGTERTIDDFVIETFYLVIKSMGRILKNPFDKV